MSDVTRELLYKKMKLLNFNDYVISFNNSGELIRERQLQTRLKPILDKLFNVGLDIKDIKDIRNTVRYSKLHNEANKKAVQDVF